jgi:hypothetical protein
MYLSHNKLEKYKVKIECAHLPVLNTHHFGSDLVLGDILFQTPLIL